MKNRQLTRTIPALGIAIMLGVEEAASKDDIDAAHQVLRELVRIDNFRDDAELFAIAREVGRSLDEARDVLRVAELRVAYLQHLKR